MESVVGAYSIMAEASLSGSIRVSTNAIVSVGQAAPPNISSIVPLKTIGQTPAPRPMLKYKLCLCLGIGVDNY